MADSAPAAAETAAARRLGGLLVVLAFGAAIAPLVVVGVPRGHDWPHELVRVAEMGAAWRDGQIVPAWAPDLYRGFGSPIFLFYAPAFGALAAAAAAALGSVAAGTVAALGLATALSGAAAALLGRVAAGAGAADAARAGRVAAIVLVLHPYRLGDVLVRNANAEALGLAILPVAIAGALLVGERAGRGALWIAVGLGGTVLAHNLTGLVAAAAVPIAVVAAAWARGGGLPRAVPAAAGGVGAALGLTAWFWLPAVLLADEVRPDELLGGKFRFDLHFVPPRELVLGTAFSAPGPWSWVLVGLAAAALARAGGDRRQRRLLVAGLLAAGGLVVLATAASAPLWRTVPLLPLFQFPWRMNGPLGVVLAMLAALAVVGLGRGRPHRFGVLLEVGVTLAALAAAAPVLLSTRALPTDLREGLADALEPGAIREFGHRATVGDEYLPRAADPALWRRGPDAVPVGRGVAVSGEGGRLEVAVEGPFARTVELPRWAFPGWTARGAGGERLAVESTARGTLSVVLPPAVRRAEVRFRPPPARWAGAALSLVTALAVAAVIWQRRRREVA